MEWREASHGWPSLRLRELWIYRELLYYLSWRDIKVRYKQTVLGIAWAVIQPFMTMVVFSIFFGHLAKVPSQGLPYPLFSYAGLVLWTFFSNGLVQSSQSLVASSALVTKVYFPRLVIPIASVISGALDFVIATLMLGVLMLHYRVAPPLQALAAPAFLLLTLTTALGVGLWLSALNVQFRDVRYVVPFLNQFWLFATPIAYASSLLHQPWRTVYGLNPMAGAIDGFRWSLLGAPPPGPMILVSSAASIALLVGGAYYFRFLERKFADVI